MIWRNSGNPLIRESINTNILLDKIDQARFTPRLIGIIESKIDESVTKTDFDIYGYKGLSFNRRE